MSKEKLRALLVKTIDRVLDENEDAIMENFNKLTVEELLDYPSLEEEGLALSTYPKSILREEAERGLNTVRGIISGEELLGAGALFMVAGFSMAAYEGVEDSLHDAVPEVDSSTLHNVQSQSNSGYSPEEIAQDNNLVVEDVIDFIDTKNKEK